MSTESIVIGQYRIVRGRRGVPSYVVQKSLYGHAGVPDWQDVDGAYFPTHEEARIFAEIQKAKDRIADLESDLHILRECRQALEGEVVEVIEP